jgi:hypothetical protein
VRSKIRVSLMMLVACSLVAVSAPSAQAAFGIESFFAANCNEAHPGCKKNPGETPAEEKHNAEVEGFTQAGGHPNFGITDFTVNTEGTGVNRIPSGAATGGIVKHIRTDVAPGVATNPEAVAKCTFEEFGKEALPGSGLFEEPKCPAESKIGLNTVVIFTAGTPPESFTPPLDKEIKNQPVFNLVQPTGLASDFGVALELPIELTKASLHKAFAEEGNKLGTPTEKFLEEKQYWGHTLIEGSVEWGAQTKGVGKADYHDYFEINASTTAPLISSRLSFTGNIGKLGQGGFLTNATSCNAPGPATTSTLTLTPVAGAPVRATDTTPIGATGCNLVPFLPAFALTPETAQSDEPDGITAVLSEPHNPASEGAGAIDSSHVKTATVTMPPGMTLNPSAAAGLAACTPAQARITSETQGTSCPVASKVGTVNLNVPGLPAESLQGNLYLGAPESGTITGPPYTMYVDAESSRYGISVRLKGTVTPNAATGQVTASFAENPEQPFSNLTLHLRGGGLAPIANPLQCGSATTTAAFVPYSLPLTSVSPLVAPFNVSGCPSPLPFNWAQSSATVPTTGGAVSAYTFTLSRPDGQQYLEKTSVTLPPGLVAKIPSVALCAEAQANAGTCPVASKVGVVLAEAGSGSPFPFSGNVYLTEKYQGAPYGLSIVVPVVAGPFNLGTEVTRSKIEVNPNTARVTVNTPKVPTIRGGIPVRLRTLKVAITAPNYILNPTNCGVFQTESLLTSTLNATQNVSTPFQATGCSGLAFKPSFKATTTALTSKNNGASLETTLNQPGKEANIKSAVVTLPKAMPSRLTTLQKACPAATFNANPFGCPAGSYVGGARANTPVLPSKMTGPAVLVSHGGAAFPDLDLVLEANGVRVIVVGNTNIAKGITTTSFLTTPDVPVTSITVNLPTGPHSALGAVANFCTTSLVMPTTITGQNGKVAKQNTKIAVAKCPIQVIGHKVVGNEAVLTVETFSAGRISGSGKGLKTVARHLNSASKKATLRVPLTSKGRPFTANVRVGFFPKKKGAPTSVAHVKVFFR